MKPTLTREDEIRFSSHLFIWRFMRVGATDRKEVTSDVVSG